MVKSPMAANQLAESIIEAIDYKDEEHNDNSTDDEESTRSDAYIMTLFEVQIDELLELKVC